MNSALFFSFLSIIFCNFAIAVDSVQEMVELAESMDVRSRGKNSIELVNSKDPNCCLAGKIIYLSDLITKDKIEGKKQLDRFYPDDGKLQAIDPYVALSIAVMRARVGDAPRAITIIDKIGALTTSQKDRILSAEAMGDVHVQQDEFVDAEKWFGDAIAGLIAYDVSKVEKSWMDRLNRKLQEAHAKQEQRKLGKAYLAYRSGRGLQMQERFPEAQQTFDRLLDDQNNDLWDKSSIPIQSLLQCAARYERLKCMSEATDLNTAIREAMSLAPEKCGPWMGALFLLRGELALFSGRDIATALSNFQQAI